MIFAEIDGLYTFTTETDDGLRLYIDDELVIDRWFDMGPTNHEGFITLSEGLHDITMEYYENGGGAEASLYWTPPGSNQDLVYPAEVNICDCDGNGVCDGGEVGVCNRVCGIGVHGRAPPFVNHRV